jgi:hypothetical protein
LAKAICPFNEAGADDATALGAADPDEGGEPVVPELVQPARSIAPTQTGSQWAFVRARLGR